MADVRSLLRNEQASRRITHPTLSYTTSGLLSCLVCNLIIKSESLWEGHLRSANHKKNLQKAQNGEVQDLNGAASKKRKMSDETEDARKKRKSTNLEEDGKLANAQGQAPEDAADEPEPQQTNNRQDKVAGGAISRDESPSIPPTQTPVPTQQQQPPPPPPSAPQPQIDEDEWAAFEREVVPLTHQNPPTENSYSATIYAAPVSAEELAAQANTQRQQQRRDTEAEDEQADEEARLVEEFEVMEALEERVKRLKEKREALRMGVGVTEVGSTIEEDAVGAEGKEKPPDPDEEEDDDDDSDEIDEWGFA